jgi:D-lactate dehydrogenase
MQHLSQKYMEFYEVISNIIPKNRIYTDPLKTVCFGHDASFYKLVPKIVIICNSSEEIREILFLSDKLSLPVVFRAAGTSLSGQAITDSILVVTSRDKRGVKVSQDGGTITLEPSVIGSYANLQLKKFNKKIGPDPASIDACMIGGIAANNASGMCCGIDQNSYKTVKSMKIILQDGFMLDTASKNSRDEFKKTHKDICEKLLSLREKIIKDEELKNLIIKKYKIKNTCGYSINSLVDYEDPVDILLHLMVGSEGTLGYIEEITYFTVDDPPIKASALMLFCDIKSAARAVQRLKTLPRSMVPAAELMDRAALRSVEDKKGMEFLKGLDENVAALLVESVASSKEKLQQQTKEIAKLLEGLKTVTPIEFSDDEKVYKRYWAIRKGLFPAVGSMREIGTTCIIEDIAFPMDKLDSAVLKLQELFKKYGYDEAIIFGHSLDSNLHFVFNQDFSKEEEVKRYRDFMKEIVDMVAIDYKGSLKAEHGTGRNMAPFVEMEWGRKAYEIMKEIKAVFDPKNLLNPGVLINDDSEIYIKNLKPLNPSDELIDKCIECGFCEPNCPSNILTLTPRQRIVANREISRLAFKKEDKKAANLIEDLYRYDGVDTCAACSLCSISCPVGIDTALLTKKLRAKELTKRDHKIAKKIVENYDKTLGVVKFALAANSLAKGVFGERFMQKSMDFIREITNGKTPKWTPYLPAKSNFEKERILIKKSDRKVVYFPSCLCRTFGKKNTQELELYEVINNLINRAGYEIIIPEFVDKLCCGTPMSSKGFKDEAKQQLKELEDALYKASNGGKYPVLCETSPCVKAMVIGFEQEIKVYEPIEFTLEFLVDKLNFKKVNRPVAVHSTCSTTKLGLKDKFVKLAKMCSDEVIVPPNVSCCGFAGDRGFTFPELNASALRWLKSDLNGRADKGYSTSITCEMGLSKHSGIDYESIFYLIEECTR